MIDYPAGIFITVTFGSKTRMFMFDLLAIKVKIIVALFFTELFSRNLIETTPDLRNENFTWSEIVIRWTDPLAPLITATPNLPHDVK